MFKKIKEKKRKGFTLVELIVVVGILATLSVLAAVTYGNISGEARRAALRADAGALVSALNTHNSLAINSYVAWSSGGTWNTPTGGAPYTLASGTFNFSLGTNGGASAANDLLGGAAATGARTGDGANMPLSVSMSSQNATWCVQGVDADVDDGVVQYSATDSIWFVSDAAITALGM